MSLLDTIERIGAHKIEPFIAPIYARYNHVLSIQDDIPYWFEIEGVPPGWYVLWPDGTYKPASAWKKVRYLNNLPKFTVIVLFMVESDRWAVVPFNISDAEQRGWPAGQPKTIHLVSGTLRTFDIVTTRSLAGTLLFENINTRTYTNNISEQMYHKLPEHFISLPSNYRNAYNIARERYLQINKEEAKKKRAESTEGNIRWQLDFMGASLVGWSENDNAVEVTWMFDGVQHTASFNRSMRGMSAGICLAGSVQNYNLSAMVEVMHEARRLHRYDLDEELWIR